MPKVLNEQLQVLLTDRDTEGNKLEPEEKAAARVLTVAPKTMWGGQLVDGQIKTEVVYEDTAGRFAMNLATVCQNCKWFNKEGWRKFRKDIDETPSPLNSKMLDDLRAILLDSNQASIDRDTSKTPRDVEETLKTGLGRCEAQSGIMGDHVFVFPQGGCPVDGRGPNGEDLSNLFQPRDQQAKQDGAAAYDSVLIVAKEGK